MNEIIIRLIDMPVKVTGMTAKDEEGDYNIYINARGSQATRLEALEHEMDHIKKGDLDRDVDILAREAQMRGGPHG